MKVLVVGGGSGGHITPAIAVIRELLAKKSRIKVEFWTDKKYYKNVVKNTTEIGMSWGKEEGKGEYIRVRKVFAGKFHRYANWKFKDYFVYFSVTMKDLVWGNIVGFCGFAGGILQSFGRFLKKDNRPDVIFLKGGFVGLPVGLVARLFNIPYVIHESDMVPGLANRILMKRAKVVAMGMPFEKGEKNWEWVGIPVAPEFKAVTEMRKKTLKRELGFDDKLPLVVITGGSQGSENLNKATREILPELLEEFSVGLIAGRKHYEEMVDLKQYEKWDEARLSSNFRMWEFSSVMDEIMGAADVVVSRAGATTIAELAELKKAVILVPYERLPGGHQVKNAEKLEKIGAVKMILDEDMQKDVGRLLLLIKEVVKKDGLKKELAQKLHETTKSDAAARLAEILIEVEKGNAKR